MICIGMISGLLLNFLPFAVDEGFLDFSGRLELLQELKKAAVTDPEFGAALALPFTAVETPARQALQQHGGGVFDGASRSRFQPGRIEASGGLEEGVFPLDHEGLQPGR